MNLFIHLNNRRIQENKERDTKLQKALKEIKKVLNKKLPLLINKTGTGKFAKR